MNKIIRHIVLSNGMHILHLKDADKNGIEVLVLTEQEYEHLTWWDRVKIKFNIK